MYHAAVWWGFFVYVYQERILVGKEQGGYGMVGGISFHTSRIISCCNLHDLARQKSSLHTYIYMIAKVK